MSNCVVWPTVLAWMGVNSLPLAAVAVSAFALLLSVWSALFTRYNARMSALPLLHPFKRTSFQPQEGTWHGEILAQIVNGGLGPAIVTKYEAFANGEGIDFSKSQIQAQLTALFGLTPHTVFESHFSHQGVIALPKDGTLDALSLKFNVPTQADCERVEQHLQDFHLRIEYQSLYGDELVFDGLVPSLPPKLGLFKRLRRST